MTSWTYAVSEAFLRGASPSLRVPPPPPLSSVQPARLCICPAGDCHSMSLPSVLLIAPVLVSLAVQPSSERQSRFHQMVPPRIGDSLSPHSKTRACCREPLQSY